MTAMKERLEQARDRIAELLKQAPEGVDKRAWLKETLGVEDFDVPDDPADYLPKEVK